MSDQDQAANKMKLAKLEQEHEDYGFAIDALIAAGCDPLRLQRFKKKKLAMKDEIESVHSKIIPDIIA